MAWTVNYTTDNQSDYDEMKAWFEHVEACPECSFHDELVDYSLNDVTKTATHNITSVGMTFPLPSH